MIADSEIRPLAMVRPVDCDPRNTSQLIADAAAAYYIAWSRQLNEACEKALASGNTQTTVLRITCEGRTLSARVGVVLMPEREVYEASSAYDLPPHVRERATTSDLP